MKNILFISFILSQFLLAHDLQKEVNNLINKAIDDGRLCEYCENIPKKTSGFYDFRYEFPSKISRASYLEFDNMLRKTIKENKLYGPKNRPLVIIPLSEHYQNDCELPRNSVFTSSCHSSNSFAF